MRIGEQAPDVLLRLHSGTDVWLHEYRGSKHVVLYFYPKDFTSGCTREGCLFSSHIRDIEAHGAAVIGISADTIESHKAFAGAYGLSFSLAADEDKTICRAYDALWFGGLAIKRITYIIDDRGIIRGKARHEFNIAQHWEYVRDVLDGLEGKRS